MVSEFSNYSGLTSNRGESGPPSSSSNRSVNPPLNLEYLDLVLQKELQNIESMLKSEGKLQCVTREEDTEGDERVIGATTTTTTIRVAADSGSVDNVVHPGELPDGITVVKNNEGNHFVGANNSRIENFGTCTTTLESKAGSEVECGWTLAEVSRPLHSVSKMCGTIEAPKHDVLFNASRCVVVPAGVVERVLQHVAPLLQYDRKGGLYVAEFKVPGFQRQGS